MSKNQINESFGMLPASFWALSKLKFYSNDAKLLATFIRSCEYSNLSSAFRFSVVKVADDLDWTKNRVNKVLEELCGLNHISFCSKTGWIWDLNALELMKSRCSSPSTLKNIFKNSSKIPSECLFYAHYFEKLPFLKVNKINDLEEFSTGAASLQPRQSQGTPSTEEEVEVEKEVEKEKEREEEAQRPSRDDSSSSLLLFKNLLIQNFPHLDFDHVYQKFIHHVNGKQVPLEQWLRNWYTWMDNEKVKKPALQKEENKGSNKLTAALIEINENDALLMKSTGEAKKAALERIRQELRLH